MDSPVEEHDIPPSTSQPGPFHESLDTLQDFFIDDNGNNMLILPAPKTASSRNAPLTLARAESLASLTSVTSAITVGTVAPTHGMIDLSLAEICNYIDKHRPLQQAYIVSSECYSQMVGSVTHRFLVLQLRRPHRKVIWLRLDRWRGEKVPIMRFLTKLGTTKAIDRGLLSGTRKLLVGDSSRENRQVFVNPPNLEEFSRFLRIITEETSSYRIWAENSWFFCSLIQQHLEGAQTGWFVDGKLSHADLASRIRLRFSSRVWEGRKTPAASRGSMTRSIKAPAPEVLNPQLPEDRELSTQYPRPHVPYEGPSAELIGKLHELDEDTTLEDEAIKAKVKKALELAPNIAIIDSLPKSVRKRADKFIDVIDEIDAFLNNSPEREPDTLIYCAEAVRLQRALYIDTPLSSQGDLARLLRNQAVALHEHERDEEACVLDEEALAIRREGYRVHPSANRARLAGILHTYSIHLCSIKRLEEALSKIEEAVVLRRLLYEYDPDEYIDPLSDSLENLGLCQGSMCRFEDAKLAEEEALGLRRIMYENDQAKNREFLARCLHNYSITLDDCGLPKESRAAQAERDALRALMNEGENHTSSYSASTNTSDDDDASDDD
ncbi:hypothetical protein DL93DRAFT_2194721 [Clavulina sp. PMI_390]|nr:hypothetical protein DL93DRAFT_2194721 [Clavulina sp. PMI_390]